MASCGNCNYDCCCDCPRDSLYVKSNQTESKCFYCDYKQWEMPRPRANELVQLKKAKSHEDIDKICRYETRCSQGPYSQKMVC